MSYQLSRYPTPHRIRIYDGIDPSLCCPNCFEATSATVGGSFRCDPCGLNWKECEEGVYHLTPIDGPYNLPPPFCSSEWEKAFVEENEAYHRRLGR